MSTFKLLLAEISHRKMNFALGLVAIFCAATLFVISPTLMSGYEAELDNKLNRIRNKTEVTLVALRKETSDELGNMESQAKDRLKNLDKRTKRIMRDLGFNLRIVHKNTDLAKLYANFQAFDMPEEYIARLAKAPEITKIVHLVATLKQMAEIEGKPRLIVGMAPEATQSHIEQKAPMGFRVQPGIVFLGHEAAVGRKIGDKIEILGKSFEVGRVLEQHGRREEDIAVIMHLADAQAVLNKKGKISEIVALGCKCRTVNRIEEIRQQLEGVLPEAKVTELRVQAIARDEQRKAVTKFNQQLQAEYVTQRDEIVNKELEREGEIITATKSSQKDLSGLLAGLTNYATPLIVLVCTIWAGLMAWANVRERRNEIGLLRAVGKGSGSIAAMFLGKAILLGLLGGLAGCAMGFALTSFSANAVLEVAPENFRPAPLVLLLTIIGAPVVSALASYLPTLRAITQDPSVVLMEN